MSRQTGKSKSKRKKRRAAKALVIIEIILGIIILLAVAFGFVYFFCRVEAVSVQGTNLYSDAEITGYVLDDEYCSNAVYAYLKNKLMPKSGAEFIDHFEVEMTGLNSLTITAKEKTILGYMIHDPYFIYFNYDGVIVEISDTYVDGYMRVDGVECEEPQIGEMLSIGEAQAGYLTALIKLVQKNDLMPQVISYDEYSRITLVYETLKIVLGNSEYLEEKIDRVTYILPQIAGEHGILHLENYSVNNTDIVFEKDENSGQ